MLRHAAVYALRRRRRFLGKQAIFRQEAAFGLFFIAAAARHRRFSCHHAA